jgi:hypothetical protein
LRSANFGQQPAAQFISSPTAMHVQSCGSSPVAIVRILLPPITDRSFASTVSPGRYLFSSDRGACQAPRIPRSFPAQPLRMAYNFASSEFYHVLLAAGDELQRYSNEERTVSVTRLSKPTLGVNYSSRHRGPEI